MAKSKIERIAGIEEEIRQLENRRRELIQAQKAQERKDRTKRLCRRMGLFESLLPATIPLTEEQFKTFLEQTAASEQGRRLLAELTAQNAAGAVAQDAGGTAREHAQPAPEAGHAAQEGREDGDADGRAAQG